MSRTLLVHRILDIIDLLSDYPQGLPLTEIAAKADIPNSAAHRLLGMLIARGFATQNQLSQHYRLTVRMASVGIRFLASTQLVDLCQPSLNDLASKTGELTCLDYCDSGEIISIAVAQPASGVLRIEHSVGRISMPRLHAAGRAWLGQLDDKQALDVAKLDAALPKGQQERCRVQDEKTLRDELKKTRNRGFGVDLGESELGVNGMAVVIPNRLDGTAVGMISILAPAVRFPVERMDAILPDLQRTATELGEIWPLQALSGQIRAAAMSTRHS